jgi:Tol biopolymer transport system component
MDGSTLSAQAFDPERLELTGQAFAVADGVGRGTNGSAAFSASRSGTLAYARTMLRAGRLIWFDRHGRPGEVVGPEGEYTDLRLSRNGKRLAASLVDPKTGNPDIWLTDLDRGGSPFRFTSGPALNSAPAWSPDDSRIVFRTTRNGGLVELFQKSSAGAGNEEPVLLAKTQFEAGLSNYNGGQPDWSPDGTTILFTSLTSYGFGLWSLHATDHKLVRLLEGPFRGTHANFSPDGRFISYASDESGTRMEVYVQTFPLSERKWKISNSGGYEPRWRADGREMYYLAEDRKLMAVSVGPGPTFGVPEPLFQTRVPAGVNAFRTHYVPIGDGQRFLINTLTSDPAPVPITVVLNWTAATKK